MYYVYFMQGSRNNIKIGVSVNPDKRLKELQTAHCEKLKIVLRLPYESRAQAYETERHLHKRYKQFSLRGEWFSYALMQMLKDKMRRKYPSLTLADLESLKWARDFL